MDTADNFFSRVSRARPMLLASLLLLRPLGAGAAEFEVVDKFSVNGYSEFRSSVALHVPAGQSPALLVSAEGLPLFLVSTTGLVGISTGTPGAALDVVSTGTLINQFAQIWRDGGGVIKGSMSATGVMMADRFVGDGSALTGISGDNLGNHIATTTLNMAGFSIINAASGTFSSALTTYSTFTVAGNAFSVGGSTLNVQYGGIGIGIIPNIQRQIKVETTRRWGMDLVHTVNSGFAGTGLSVASTFQGDGGGTAGRFSAIGTGTGDAGSDSITGFYNYAVNRRTGNDSWGVEGARQWVFQEANTNSNYTYGAITGNTIGVGAGYSAAGTGVQTVTDAFGVQSGLAKDSSAGNVVFTNWAAFYAPAGYLAESVGGTFTQTNVRGFWTGNQDKGTNNTNLLIGAGAAGNWSIYNNSTYNNYFAGKLGIGTTSPASKFDVADGSITVRGTNAGVVFETSGRAITPETDPAVGGGVRVSTNVYIVGFASATKYFGDGSGLTNLTGAGDNLGDHIATTTLNMANFNVVGVSTITVSSITAAGAGVVFSTNAYFMNGNVGIGTAEPTNKLHIRKASAGGDPTGIQEHVVLESDDNAYISILTPSTQQSGFTFSNNAANARGGVYYGQPGYSRADELRFHTASAERMVIDSAGKVGIGTTAPGYRLVVSSGAGEAGNMLVISTGASNVIRMTGEGGIHANKFYGDGSGLTNLTGAGDNLGDHNATQRLNMGGNQIVGVSSLTVMASDTLASSLWVSTSPISPHLYVSTTGRVGMGTSDPHAPLHITGTGQYGNADRLLQLYQTAPGEGSVVILAANQAADGWWNIGPRENNNFGIGSSHDPGIDQRLTITSGGNVGIGTTVPLYKMTLREDSGHALMGWNRGGTDHGAIGVANDDTVILQANSVPMRFSSDGFANEHMRITPAGNIGVSTNTPEGRLDVKAAGSAPADMAQIWRNSGGTIVSSMSATGVMMAAKFVGDGSGLTGIGGILSGGVAPKLPYWISANTLGNSTLSQDSAASLTALNSTFTVQGSAFSVGGSTLVVKDGNVGIGTQSPNEKLHLYGTLGTFAHIEGGPATTSNGIKMTTNGNIMFVSNENGRMGFFNTSAERMSILNNGNVGIGTTAPGARLEVGGTASPSIKLISSSDSNYQAQLFANYDAGHQLSLTSSNNVEVLGRWGNDVKLSAPASGDLIFQPGGTQQVTFKSSGNVGIGTPNPGGKLSIQGSGAYNSTGWGQASDVSIRSSEMTDNAYHSILQLVSIRQSLTVGQNSQGYLGFSTIDDSNDGGITDAGRIAIVNESGNSFRSPTALSFWTSAGITDIAATEKMRITSGGNVGIGTAGPGANLHISSTSASASQDMLKITTGTANADVFVVKGSGNVGIGTAGPEAKLEVAGAVMLDSSSGLQVRKTWVPSQTMAMLGAGGTHGYTFLRAIDSDAGDGVRIEQYDGSPIAYFQQGGNVGIGTASPGNILHISKSQNTETNIELANADTGADAQVRTVYKTAGPKMFTVGKTGSGHTYAGDAYLWNVDNTHLRFATNDTERVRIANTGNVGIGTTSPTHKLRVEGGMLATSSITAQAFYGDGTTLTGVVTNPMTTKLNINATPSLGTQNQAGVTIDTHVFVTAGNVGIGTAGPTSRLHVSGTSEASPSTNNGGILQLEGSSSGKIVFGNLTGSPYAAYIQAGGGASYPLALNPNGGNVGIGTTNPQSNLNIHSAGNGDAPAIIVSGSEGGATNRGFAMRYYNNVSATGNLLPRSMHFALGSDGDGIVFGKSPANTLGLDNDFTRWMTLRGGNVGIGTTAPAFKASIFSNSVNISTPLVLSNDGPEFAAASGGVALGFQSYDMSTDPERFNDQLIGRIAVENTGSYSGDMTFGLMYSGTIPNGIAEWMRITKTGNVGIGTAAPWKKLHITDSGSGVQPMFVLHNNAAYANGSGAQMLFAANSEGGMKGIAGVSGVITDITESSYKGDLVFSASNLALPDEKMRITSAGNVGIGTASPGRKLQIQSTGEQLALFYDASKHGVMNTRSDGNLQVYAHTGAAYGNILLGVDGATTNAGNIGIGTTAPGQKLAIKSGGANTNVLSILESTDDANRIVDLAEATGGHGTLDLRNGSAVLNTRIASSGDSYFNGGNVGIGTTSPDSLLSINSPVDNVDILTLRFPAGSTADKLGILFKGNDGTYNINYAELIGGVENWSGDDGYLGYKTSNNTVLSEKMRLTSNGTLEVGSAYTGQSGTLDSGLIVAGNVGIGTTAPSSKLDVAGDVEIPGGNALRLNGQAAGTPYIGYGAIADRLDIHNEVNANSDIYLIAQDSVVNWVNGQARTTINNQGNVGIGTTSPAAKLHVAGGDLQTGDATASTVSASGYITMANIPAPSPAPGRLYYDSSSNTLKIATAAASGSWVVLGPRTYYKTTATSNGIGPGGQCSSGFHMCKATELLEGRSWNRMGDQTIFDGNAAWADLDGAASPKNCTNWTSNSAAVYGMICDLPSDVNSTTGGDKLHFWCYAGQTCNSSTPVWCCSD